MISSTAKPDRIVDAVTKAHQNGLARGGDIAEAAKNRLESPLQTIETAHAMLQAAAKAASAAWVLVLAADNNADNVIGAVRDEMYNALGRPRQSPAMDEVFPGGMGTYTNGDPRNQPVLMQVLHARILAASATQWPEPKRTAWAAAIDAARLPFKDAVEAHRPMEAAETVADAGYRAAVRSAHARLVSFKRDLKSLGLTEAQIHEIIPDAGSPNKPEST